MNSPSSVNKSSLFVTVIRNKGRRISEHALIFKEIILNQAEGTSASGVAEDYGNEKISFPKWLCFLYKADIRVPPLKLQSEVLN
jgi:hypothetical protein